jgi:hypothetical protein
MGNLFSRLRSQASPSSSSSLAPPESVQAKLFRVTYIISPSDIYYQSGLVPMPAKIHVGRYCWAHVLGAPRCDEPHTIFHYHFFLQDVQDSTAPLIECGSATDGEHDIIGKLQVGTLVRATISPDGRSLAHLSIADEQPPVSAQEGVSAAPGQ